MERRYLPPTQSPRRHRAFCIRPETQNDFTVLPEESDDRDPDVAGTLFVNSANWLMGKRRVPEYATKEFGGDGFVRLAPLSGHTLLIVQKQAQIAPNWSDTLLSRSKELI
ncbi:hypothetical protein PM082_009095 [Marasmius tenuissimus]|nr:hypothetical protein PM082_009095 [Marasmius tenuissimus]